MPEDITSCLVKKAQSGDLRSFEQLIEQHQAKVFNIALGIMGNRQDAEDAAQIAFIKIYRAIGDFKSQSKFSTWVYRITVNVCMDEVRKKKRHGSVSDEEIGDAFFADDSSSPEAQSLKSEQSEELKKAIASLKPEHRKMIVLRDINGFSYEEIAKITRLSAGTVKSRINRARAHLKDALISSGYFM